MISALISGFMLGLALIGPIGPQNLYVIRAGLALSPVRVLAVVLAATLCDALLITLGTAGAGAVVTEIPGMLGFLLAAGAAFLVYLGVKSLRAGPPEMGLPSEDGRGGATKLLTRQTVGVSLLNPHAILDTRGDRCHGGRSWCWCPCAFRRGGRGCLAPVVLADRVGGQRLQEPDDTRCRPVDRGDLRARAVAVCGQTRGGSAGRARTLERVVHGVGLGGE